MDSYISQDFIQCSFEDRERLDNNDLARIRELGLKYRGRDEWPLFRRRRPGKAAWHLTQEDMDLMVLAFQGALHMQELIREDPVEKHVFFPIKTILLEKTGDAKAGGDLLPPDMTNEVIFKHRRMGFPDVSVTYPSPSLPEGGYLTLLLEYNLRWQSP